ncbi:hypothetical protein P5673_004095 [Acropora cervicornis]|uniref:Uncharacterized protein n=1 Tax=Acropora cervicornis TaxID=6130 RepID=A0AAD9R1P2_ACRCE|nr:hypothetical protein P5673_004095 [Acropora cervicornis]
MIQYHPKDKTIQRLNCSPENTTAHESLHKMQTTISEKPDNFQSKMTETQQEAALRKDFHLCSLKTA